jgi:RHS repeat-associated protein
VRSAITQPHKGIIKLTFEVSEQTCAGVYSFGFNGKENDNEVHNATGTSQDFGARMYDNRAGRFLSLDPYAAKEPGESPYGFAGNSPVMFIDQNGEYKMSPRLQRKYPVLTNLIKNLESLATVDPRVWEAFKSTMGLTEEQARSVVRWDEGPRLKVRNMKNVVSAEGDDRPNVQYGKSSGKLDGQVAFNKKMVDVMEGTRGNPEITPADAAAMVFVTALHEPQHLADKEINGHRTRGREPGYEFEQRAFDRKPDDEYGTDNIKEFEGDNPELHRSILEKSGIPRESEKQP